ncbi:MAG: N-acylglucosamine 2-epimerase, partial [Phycisphaeraceae bacterium]|nr:N-acylglucosamine 2-epimerase [Phycisphaeraceae bacterium]
RPAWRSALDTVFDFGRRHAVDDDGRMFFHLDRAGRPIRKRRYAYAECFAAMAMAEVAALDRDPALAREAEGMFRLARRVMTEPGLMAAKTMNRPAKSFGHPMISLGVSQVLRDSIGGAFADAVAIEAVDEIRADFLHAGLQAVMETVAPDGSVIDHLESRLLNPGHAMEGAWFMMDEGRRRDDAGIVDAGLDMLDWSWDRGWDRKHGG